MTSNFFKIIPLMRVNGLGFQARTLFEARLFSHLRDLYHRRVNSLFMRRFGDPRVYYLDIGRFYNRGQTFFQPIYPNFRQWDRLCRDINAGWTITLFMKSMVFPVWKKNRQHREMEQKNRELKQKKLYFNAMRCHTFLKQTGRCVKPVIIKSPGHEDRNKTFWKAVPDSLKFHPILGRVKCEAEGVRRSASA